MKKIAPPELIELAKKLTLDQPKLDLVPDTDEYPWFIRDFQRQLLASDRRGDLLLPNLQQDNESVLVFSDYGGESPDSRYLTYCFLVCAWNQTGNFIEGMARLRERHGLNAPFKEIAYKDFRYGPIKRALPGYLSLLSHTVNGLLVTLVVEKKARTVFGHNVNQAHEFITTTLANNGFGQWKPDVAEKLLRVTHFAAYLVALLSRPGQKVMWMTDHDAIAPTADRYMDSLNLFNRLLFHYGKCSYGTVGGALPFVDRDPTLDLLSATDVVAGSVEHYFTRRMCNTENPSFKGEALSVLRWMSGQGIALKKRTMIIRQTDQELFSGGLEFKLPEPDPNATYAPIPIRSRYFSPRNHS